MDAQRNVVIIPNQQVIDEAIRRSELVNQLSRQHNSESRVVLSTIEKRWPHVTLYQFGLPEANVASLGSTVAQVAAKTGVFQVTLQGYELYRNTGIFWTVKEPRGPLQELHEMLVSKLNEVREGVVPEQHRELFASDSGLTATQRAMLGKWGYPTAFDDYQPHITLGDTEVAPDILNELPSESVEIEVNQIHISDLGPNGTCPGPIETFTLGSG